MEEHFLTLREFDEYKRTRDKEFEEYKKTQKEALGLQAAEYQRRLTDLNHEAERLAKFLETTVSEQSFTDFKALLDERVGALRKAEDQRIGGMILLRVLAASGAVGLLLSVLNSMGIRFGG